jgi:xylulose-5-phosphate/fructose-6-phosphate phosphoketolase
MINQIDRFNLVIDVIDRVEHLQRTAAHVKGRMRNALVDNMNFAHAEGVDRKEIRDWVWS